METFLNKRLIIYGSGNRCKEFIQKGKGFCILGIIDRFKVSGRISGLPIITWEKVDSLEADAIVIASLECWYREIYERIFSLCLAKGLRIFTVSGQDLMAYFGNPYSKCIPQISINKLKKMVDSHDVISFDVFDTLLMRAVVKPQDVFDLVNISLKNHGIEIPDFRKIRVTCELETKGKTFDEIYLTIKKRLSLSDELIEHIKSIEIETEQRILCVRNEIKEIYDYALKRGKIIIIVSDMYLPKSVITHLLYVKGIDGFSKMFVSCEEGLGKGEGLFDVVKTKMGKARSYIHFGDNSYLDGFCSQKSGMDSFIIAPAMDYFISAGFENSLNYVNTSNDSRIIGSIISSCFSNRNSSSFSLLKEVTEVFCVPFVILYLDKIIRLVRKKDYKGVIFPARDGYCLKELFDTISKRIGLSVNSYYIASSRKLMVRTGINNEEDLVYSYKYAELMKEPIHNLYGIPKDEIECEDTLSNIKGCKDIIVDRSRMTKEKYKTYISNLGIDIDESYLLCELNGQGTTQLYLSRIFNKPLDTVYLVRWHNGDTLESVAVYDFYKQDEIYSCLNYRFDIIESFFSAPHPSIIDLTEGLLPVYSEDNRSLEQINVMEQMQRFARDKVLDFFDEYYDFDNGISPGVGEQILQRFERSEFKKELKELTVNKYYDDLTGDYVDI